jgi:hypothetical protein
MTILIVDLVQQATGTKHQQTAIDESAHGIALRQPLTAEGMAVYAGVMAKFAGTDSGDWADAIRERLIGFTGGTLAELQDSIGDTIKGRAGSDEIIAGSGADTINGGDGHDSITGGAGADIIFGGAGNDVITYDGSDVSIDGGAGDDTLIVRRAATINLGSTSGDTPIVTGFEEVSARGARGRQHYGRC